MTFTLTEQLVALIRSKAIGAHDLHQAALFTLDAIANTVGGRNSQPGKILCQWARSHCNDTPR